MSTVKAMQARVRQLKGESRTIAFVPTMGFLHDGHLSLMREGKRRADALVASIFVNPAQFGPSEDFETYPRDMDRDMALAREAGVDILFTPKAPDIYGEGFETFVRLEKLPNHLCGLSRPVFFTGVATVVAKLFNIVSPDVAVFGEKDYQQLQVIRRLVRDLNFEIDVVGGATVREPDGLAMSSRNAYLSPEQRPAALSLVRSLETAREMVGSGITDANKILSTVAGNITRFAEAEIDYIAIIDPETLEDVATIDRPVRMALAVKVGATRLIDNMELKP
ncbi:MAG: pantoate--beta-alanine ligase [Desulfobacterales bacterium]